jgi:hypothetical protein
MREEWRPASVQFGDWRGTVAMDDPDEWAQIEQYARIPKDWLILGIELAGGSELGNERTWAWILAIRQSDWSDLGNADGIRPGQEISVKRFPVREADAVDVLKAMKRFSIRASLRSVAHAQLIVTDEADDA